MENPTKANTLMKEAGENYYYVKTILNNKTEIFKLELLQHISNMGNVVVIAVLALFFTMILVTLLVATMVVFLAQLLGSYLYALLASVAIMTLLFIVLYTFMKPMIIRLIEKKLIDLTSNETPNS